MKRVNVKIYQFTTQCKGDTSHAFKTAKITVSLQDELHGWGY